MKIGIVTYVKCDNYGAELQAYALQWKLNKLGYDAEVIDLQKIEKDLASNASSIVPAIVNRFKILGWKAPWSILKLAINVLKRKVTAQKNENNIKLKHRLFIDFFENYIRHSKKHYTIEEIREATDLDYDVYIAGGRQNTGLDLIQWVKQCESLGAGEILLTSMDRDGTRDGFDIDMLNTVMNAVSIPVIASGGCGDIQDIVDVFKKTNCDGALAASLFHYGEATIDQVKEECAKHSIPVRRNI